MAVFLKKYTIEIIKYNIKENYKINSDNFIY